MMAAVLLAALLRDDPVGALLEKAEEAGRSRKDFTARMTAETEGKVVESWGFAAGTVAFRAADRALFVELREARAGARAARTLIRKDEAGFHPFELWRRGAGRWLQGQFEVALAPDPGGEELPEALSGPDGTPLKARRARPAVRRANYDRAAPEAPEPGGRGVVLELTPKGGGPRQGLLTVRIHLDPDSFRVVRVVTDSPARRVSYALEDIREDSPPDDRLFEAPEGGRR